MLKNGGFWSGLAAGLLLAALLGFGLAGKRGDLASGGRAPPAAAVK